MTLSEMRTMITDLINETDVDSDTHFTATELDTYINKAYRTLCREIIGFGTGYYEKSDTITVSSGDVYKDLPSDFAGNIISLVNTTNDPPTILSKRIKNRKYFLYSPEDNPPTHFDFRGYNQIWLYPTHNGTDITLTITYEYLPAELSLGASSFDFPIGYEKVIAYEVILDCLLKDNRTSAELYPRYMNLKQSMLKDLARPKQTFTAKRVQYV